MMLESGRMLGVNKEMLGGGNIRGVAGIIFSEDGKILVGTEQRDKPSTKKLAGQTSIPMETLKPFEVGSQSHMIAALLTEITNDMSMDLLKERLSCSGIVDRVSVDEGVDLAIVFLRFQGDSYDEMPFISPNEDEFSDLRWEAGFLQDCHNVRPYAGSVINFLESRLYGGDDLDIEYKNLNLDEFSPYNYSNYREQVNDILMPNQHLVRK